MTILVALAAIALVAAVLALGVTMLITRLYKKVEQGQAMVVNKTKALEVTFSGALIMPVLHKGDISMDAIADKLALSRQTLFRKLKAEGTTFEKVLDELRHKLALDYLRSRTEVTFRPVSPHPDYHAGRPGWSFLDD